jgi:molybdenum cofactor synthesis domain-containing protein
LNVSDLTVVETAAALLIGAELLSGKVRDANLQELATTLRGLGIELTRVVMVTDDPEEIAAEITTLSQRHGVVFTSGGVGPTHDDVTVHAAAQAFGVAIVHSEEVEALMRRVYGDELTPEHLRMARIPEGAQLVYAGTSVWPAVTVGNVWLLPGIPEVFRAKLEIVREHLRGPGRFHSLGVYCRSAEASLCRALETVVAEYPTVAIGSYPKWGGTTYRTHVTFDGRVRDEVVGCRDRFVALLPAEEVVRRD